MRAARPLAVLALASASLLLAGNAADAARHQIDYMDRPIPQWREGPVRYIITKWEDEEYKSLKTEEDRARFIEAFWRRRDPTPDTPGNEFRAEFWRRVRDANRLYAETTSHEAWRTDMGKIHILLGPPDDIYRDMVPQGNRGTVVWTYRNSKSPGIGPNVVIAFARDVTGEFRLSTQPSKDADPKQGGPDYQPPMGTGAEAQARALQARAVTSRLFNLTDPLIRQAGGPASASDLTLLTELAKLQQPPKEWEIRETVTTQEFFGSVPMRARADFFRTTTSRTLVVLTGSVRSVAVHYHKVGGRELPDVAFYARIMDLTGNDLVKSLEKDTDFAPAAENERATLDDDLVYQARALLEPGTYKALLTVLDRAGGRAGSYQIPVTVPDLNGSGLTLSSLVLARAIDPVAAGDDAALPATAPFVIGGLRVLPRLTQVFSPGEELVFYYQVYGAAKEPSTGQPSLDVDYAFLTLEAEKTRDLGHVSFSDQKNEAHGYAVSLKDWPKGPYMLRVSVTDRMAQASTTRDLVFEIR